MIGTRIGPYEIVEEIGKGGMATVYRAYQPNLDRDVAIKIIHRAIALDSASMERFQREARLLTKLVHPQLLPIYDYDAAHDPPYIVMRYLESGSLKDIIDRGKLPHEEIIYMLRQIAAALDYAHRNNVIHRDIKPSNVMFDADGNAFLTDFGIARTIEKGQDMTQSGYALGTPGYMSPEQGMGVDKINSRADIYSLGVMTFQMLTGQLPYNGDTPLSIIFKHISDPIPDITALDQQLSPVVNRVMGRVMAKQPEDRYSTASEFVDDLAKALNVSNTTTPVSLRRAVKDSMDKVAAKREQQKAVIESTMMAFELSRPIALGGKVPTTQSLPDVPTSVVDSKELAISQAASLKKTVSLWRLVAVLMSAFAILALIIVGLRNNQALSLDGTSTLADDATLNGTDLLNLTPTNSLAVEPLVVDVPLNASEDDVNEVNQNMVSDSPTLWIGSAGSVEGSYLGLRFNGINIPAGATITSADIQYYSTEKQWIILAADIGAEASDDAEPFSVSLPSQRVLTAARVAHESDVEWLENNWYSLGEVTTLVQEVINRPGWQSSNSMAFVLHGKGEIWARKFMSSFDGDPALAPRLSIEYVLPEKPLPTVTITVTPSATTTLEATVTLTSSPTDTPLPTETATPTETETPTLTVTSSPTVTPSYTPTLATPEVRALRATIIRSGPGSQYPKVADIMPDMRLILIGSSEDGAWFQVMLPDEQVGWLAYNPVTFEFQGDIQSVPLVLAPTDTPTYTPSPTSTYTLTPTPTPTDTVTPTVTLTPTETVTPSPTETAVATTEPTQTPTLLPSPTPIPPGRLPFVADFEDANGLRGWDYDAAAWQVVNEGGEGILIGQGKLEQPIVVLGREQPEWQTAASGNLVISFSVNLDRESGGARVIFRCGDLNGCKNGYTVLEILPGTLIMRRNGVNATIFQRDIERPLKQIQAALTSQQWYDIRIWVEGSRTLVYLDRKLVMSVEDLNTPQLGSGAVILQTNSSFRAVRWDNIIIQHPEAASDHFQASSLPVTWQTTNVTMMTIGREDSGNQYLQMKGAVTVKPTILPIRDLSLTCRVWIEQGGYQLSFRQGVSGSLRLTFEAGNLLVEHLDGTGAVLFSRSVNNFYNRNRWEDLNISFIGDRLLIYRDGISRFEDTITGSPASGGMTFETRTNDILRLDDCLITETAASSNASARFALDLQQQVFARQFLELRSDISDAFDDKFRTDVFWVGGLRAAGEFVVDTSASTHQKYLRIIHENRPVFRLLRDDIGVELFGKGEDRRNFSDSSDFLSSVAVRMPQTEGTAWFVVRATPSLGGTQLNGYQLGLRRDADGSINTIVRYQDGNRNETYFDAPIPVEDDELPEWINLTVITYKQRIAFFVEGHFIVAIDQALALGGSVAIGVDDGSTADFDNLIIRDTTPHGD